MKEYHKIITAWARDPETKFKTLILGAWATPEFAYLKDNEWVWTEKVDGTNIRIIYDAEINPNVVVFGGKTDRAQIPPFLHEKLIEIFPVEKFNNFGGPVCLYGEGYGAKIQKGDKYISNGVNFVLFDVKVGRWWLQREDVEDVAAKMNLGIVPVIGRGTLQEMISRTMRGFDSLWGNFQAEGIVARPSKELCDRGGNRIITKIKHRDFT